MFVQYELVDGAGKYMMSGQVPMPAERQEAIIGSFVVQDGKIVQHSTRGVGIVGQVLR